MEANIVNKKEKEVDFTLEDIENAPGPQFSKLNLNDVLDYIEPAQLMNKLFNIKSKLLPNAKIIIHSYDLYEIAMAVISDKMSTLDFNMLIKDRKQLLCITDLLFILKQLNFKIMVKDIDASKFLVEAVNV